MVSKLLDVPVETGIFGAGAKTYFLRVLDHKNLGFGVPYCNTFLGTWYLEVTRMKYKFIQMYTLFSPWLLQSPGTLSLSPVKTYKASRHPPPSRLKYPKPQVRLRISRKPLRSSGLQGFRV